MPLRGNGTRPKQQQYFHRGKKQPSQPVVLARQQSVPKPPIEREVQEQEDELLAMASIFDPRMFSVQEGSYSGLFCAHLDLPAPFSVHGFEELPGASRDDSSSKDYQLKFLPPIQLHFRLPPDYPSTNKPNFKLSCKWLNKCQLTKLCQRLDAIWEENKGDVILFLWTAFLSEDALEHLGIGDRLDLSWVRLAQQSNEPSSCDGQMVNEHYNSNPTQRETESKMAADQPETTTDSLKTTNAAEPKSERNTSSNVASNNRSNVTTKNESKMATSDESKMAASNGADTVVKCESKTAANNDYKTTNRYRRWRQRPHVDQSAPNGLQSATTDAGDARAVLDQCSSNAGALLSALLEHNRTETERAFSVAAFDCGVCLEQRPGAQCMAFKGCEHVYCKSCMRAYFEVQIEQGNVKSLTCPHDKCPSQALPFQVRELVCAELFAKYDELLLASTLDSMSDIIYCPRLACQCAVLLEPNCTMGSCPACSFVFCLFCCMAYHGVEPCKMKDGEFQKLFDSYQNGTREERAALESRYGKAHLQKLVEGILSDSWVKENSKRCPSCTAHIEKNDGCNKMTCWKCNCYFCWLCMTKLDLVTPYQHFDQRSGTCFGRLFTGNFNMSDSDDSDDEDFPEIDEDVEFGQF